jgi:transcriptional regulator with XRE-family HTH domain
LEGQELAARHIALRERAGLTQEQEAKMAGVSPTTISGIESGKITRPHLKTLLKIARALGVDVGELRESGKVQAPLSSIQPSLNGFEEERREDTEYVHIETLIDRIGAAGNVAREVVQEWRSESARILAEGKPPAKYRTLEMRSLHNELSAIFMADLRDILEGARRGTISVGREGGEPQGLAQDPSLWPHELREFVYDVGSHIVVLPAVIESLEREWAARGFEVASSRTQRGGAIEDGLPHGVLTDAGWQYAIEKAREEAGVR